MMNQKILGAICLSSTVLAQASPIVNLFELGIAPGQAYACHQVVQHNIQTSMVNELGTLAMYSMISKDDPQLAYMFEIYADEQAYQTHRQSPQYHYFLEQSPKILNDHKVFFPLEAKYQLKKHFVADDHTFVHMFKVWVKPEHQQAFDRLVKEEMNQVLAHEADLWAMYASTEKAHPNRWVFLQIFADSTAYQAYRQSVHFQQYVQASQVMVEHNEEIELRSDVLMAK